MSERLDDPTKSGRDQPKMLPAKVVGLLRARCRQQEADIAALKAKNQGQAVEIEQLRAALGRRGTNDTEQ